MLQAINFLNEAYRQKTVDEIDAQIISGWLKIRADRAERLLPLFQQLFLDHKHLWKDKNTYPTLKNTYSIDNTPSNQHGSTHAHAPAVEVIEDVYSSSPLPPKQESQEFKKFMSIYPKPFDRKAAWAEWYFQGLDFSADKIMDGLKAYLPSQDWTKENGKYIPKPLKFLEEQRWSFAPGQKLRVVSYKETHVDRLMAAKRIRSLVDSTLFYDVCDLERDTFNQIHPKAGGPRLIENEFEPVAEELEKHA
jgi:hypothetical protein